MKTYEISNQEKRVLQLIRLNGALALLQNEKRTTTYEALGKAIGLFAGSAQFAHLLGKSMKDDHRQGRPFKCALVTSSKTGMPGDGFFTYAAKMLGKEFKTELERTNFWKDMKNRAFNEND